MKRASLGVSRFPGSGAKLGEAVGDATTEELDEFGGEALVESSHAEDRVRGPPVVGLAEGLDGALELGPRLEGEGVEEGDGVKLAMPSDEARLPGDALDHSRREQGDERLEVVIRLGTLGVGLVSPPRTGLPRWVGHPIEVDLPS